MRKGPARKVVGIEDEAISEEAPMKANDTIFSSLADSGALLLMLIAAYLGGEDAYV